MTKPVKVSFIYTTFPEKGVALSIAQDLIKEKLAACINLIPNMTSVYEWEGQIEVSEEISAFIKTSSDKANEVMNRVRAVHPYSVPSLMVLEVKTGDDKFFDWIAEQTSK